MKLSLRLQTLLDLCVPAQAVWDLCCDHGLLGLAALASGRFGEIVFNDAVDHVLEELKPRLSSYGSRARCLVGRAEEIAETLYGNIVIAGIGGEKTFKILNHQIAAGRLQASRLLLCPEKDAEWLAAQTFSDYTWTSRFEIPHGHGTRWIYQLDRISSRRTKSKDHDA